MGLGPFRRYPTRLQYRPIKSNGSAKTRHISTMATSSLPLSFLSPRQHPTTTTTSTTSSSAFPTIPKLFFHSRKSLGSTTCNIHHKQGVSALTTAAAAAAAADANDKWRIKVSFFPAFLKKTEDANIIKEELLQAIEPLDRGAEATPDDQKIIDQIARRLEAVNPTKEPLKSKLLDGKWELIYTTSQSILQVKRPKFLRSKTNYQAINVDTLRAQNMESWPFFNQVTADLTPLNTKKVAVKFDYFKIAGLIPVKAPGRAKGELEVTYLDDELRISRGDLGNLFILKMVDPSYRVPV